MNTTDIISNLYLIFNALNEKYFDDELPQPFITIKQGKTKAKDVYGTFTPDSWAHKDGEDFDETSGSMKTIVSENRIHEIAMSGEYLSRPFENMCATLCHEMVHMYCNCNDIEDTSNKGVYHNNKFKREAEKRGLIIEKAKMIGWSVTTPTADFINFVNGLEIDRSPFNWFRDTWLNQEAKVTPKKKWVCPKCGQQVTGSKKASIGCWICMMPMDFWDLTEKSNEQILIDNNDGYAFTENGWFGYLNGVEDDN